MKKSIILALITLATSSVFAASPKVDLKIAFKADQEVALFNLVNSWVKPESEAVLLDNYASLISADSRFRQVVGDTGLVTKLFSMSASKNKELSSIDRLNLFMMAYYKEVEKLDVDTRNMFSQKPYNVNF